MKTKYLYTMAGVLFALALAADSSGGWSTGTKSEGMNGWFYNQETHERKTMRLQNTTPPDPPPGVPLDGGLIGLIAAGGAVGYKRYKQMNDDRANE